ncbi:hypothetical protein Kpol_467p22 [Vanderwaltozyma polyspora DSM 70294]|uniref:NAD(P)-binding domain-containing protein n=1 Tax=Vanderwaltozyma polyspora (strain ATCC 22028 / DSM 70294 / BCRC 21397 / CBS 2163 / NBRC 10782 / NRRL Y-8283 / UCD 57-17) TaxID=436907 RepID=A7TQG6_VANPO|nr:uncharacterized protein Kpol_467p22 [Vanderwaltozyma polyspora DSM 70294]EDO15510.1 hypothetical protein Kpol_467p22 [Vanderwaltozyma polyspora DSM 70294]
MFRVAVVGANGNIGRRLINIIKSDSRFGKPLAIVRTEEQATYFRNDIGIDASVTSIEAATPREIAFAIEGYDAVVFTAGAGGSGLDKLINVDLDGCIKSAEACELVGIKRFVLVSAIKADDRDFWWNIDSLRDYYIAKRAADCFIRTTNLDYTILQPGWLNNNTGTGKYLPVNKLDESTDASFPISREDVANFISKCLASPENTIRKTIPLTNGEATYEQFVRTL